jgi:hypothetical protein
LHMLADNAHGGAGIKKTWRDYLRKGPGAQAAQRSGLDVRCSTPLSG